jgi:uncharacterized protein (TIGR02271 family)
MMAKTIVGCFQDQACVTRATDELRAAGIPENRIQRMGYDEATTSRTGATAHEERWQDKLARFFGVEHEEEGATYADEYAGVLERGDTLLTVDVEDERADTVATILQRCGAQDIDRGGATATRGATARSGTQRAVTTAEGDVSEPLPVVEERMDVGKRVVSRGGVRIHSYITETPVEELVRLREERVSVQRRPVDRPLAAGDEAFKERTIEVTEQGEQATVSKTPRVVEEVRVGKRVEERQQRVSERVKRQDVAVEELPKTGTGTKR